MAQTNPVTAEEFNRRASGLMNDVHLHMAPLIAVGRVNSDYKSIEQHGHTLKGYILNSGDFTIEGVTNAVKELTEKLKSGMTSTYHFAQAAAIFADDLELQKMGERPVGKHKAATQLFIDLGYSIRPDRLEQQM